MIKSNGRERTVRWRLDLPQQRYIKFHKSVNLFDTIFVNTFVTMTLYQAIEHLINSEDFKNKAKQKNSTGSKYRMFLSRYKNGDLKNGAAVDFLIGHGYKIEVKNPK